MVNNLRNCNNRQSFLSLTNPLKIIGNQKKAGRGQCVKGYFCSLLLFSVEVLRQKSRPNYGTYARHKHIFIAPFLVYRLQRFAAPSCVQLDFSSLTSLAIHFNFAIANIVCFQKVFCFYTKAARLTGVKNNLCICFD